MKRFVFCVSLMVLEWGLWAQTHPPMAGLISVPVGVDSGSRFLLIADDGPIYGLGLEGVAVATLAQQPYGLGLLRNQRLWVGVMRGRQSGSLRVEQGGRHPLQSLRVTIDYARELSPQIQLGIRNGIELATISGDRKLQYESTLQVRWQPQRFFWVEWQTQRNGQPSLGRSTWDFSTTLGFVWPARAATVICLRSQAGQGFQIEWRGQAYLHPRAGLYAELRPIEQQLGLGWWINKASWQFLLTGRYHAVLGLSPQVGMQYFFQKPVR
jgi:hypothetical protein